MLKRKVKRSVVVAFSIIIAGTMAGSIQQANAKSKTVEGTYQTLYVSATSTSGWVDISNKETSKERYVYVTEKAYDSKGKLLSNDSCDGVISSGGRTACGMGLKGVKKVTGKGKIYKGKTSATTLLETKSATVER